MKKLLVILLVVSHFKNTYAQRYQVDSLWKLMNQQAQDTSKAMILSQLSTV